MISEPRRVRVVVRAVVTLQRRDGPTTLWHWQDAIRAALSQPGRPGVRRIAAQFGVAPSTVQRISRPALGNDRRSTQSSGGWVLLCQSASKFDPPYCRTKQCYPSVISWA
jgi:hypothetical protein